MVLRLRPYRWKEKQRNALSRKAATRLLGEMNQTPEFWLNRHWPDAEHNLRVRSDAYPGPRTLRRKALHLLVLTNRETCQRSLRPRYRSSPKSSALYHLPDVV